MKIDQFIRSKRKTVALIVEGDGRLVVRAPLRLALAQIQVIVDQKADWIRQKREQLKAQAQADPLLAPKAYRAGESFWFLGKSYPLEIVAPAAAPLRFHDRFLLAQESLPRAEKIFTAWYRTQARALLTERVRLYAQKMGVSFEKIRISSARTRWGSCSSRGALSFTWRLVMAPLDVVDYVVVHELAHRIEPNHSARFWAQVAAVLPDYKTRRDWLKQHGAQLTL